MRLAPAGAVGDGLGPGHDPEKAGCPGADPAQTGPQEQPGPERERGLHEHDEEVHERGVAQRYRRRHGRGEVGVRQQEDRSQRQRVHEDQQVGGQPQRPDPGSRARAARARSRGRRPRSRAPRRRPGPLGARHREPPQDEHHRRRARGGRHHQAPPLLTGEGSVQPLLRPGVALQPARSRPALSWAPAGRPSARRARTSNFLALHVHGHGSPACRLRSSRPASHPPCGRAEPRPRV